MPVPNRLSLFFANWRATWMVKQAITFLFPLGFGIWGQNIFQGIWQTFSPEVVFFCFLVILYLVAILLFDYVKGRSVYAQIGHVRHRLSLLQALPKARSAVLARMLDGGMQFGCKDFLNSFFQSGSCQSLETIAEAIVKHVNFCYLNMSNHSFRVSICLPDSSGTKLKVCAASSVNANRPVVGREFNKDKTTTAGYAWLEELPFAIPDVPKALKLAERRKRSGKAGMSVPFRYLSPQEKICIKSILAIPLYDTVGPNKSFHGVICLDTSHCNLFKEFQENDSTYFWSEVIGPFADRVVFYSRLTDVTDRLIV